jgi:hypothetical protein
MDWKKNSEKGKRAVSGMRGVFQKTAIGPIAAA